MIIASFMAESSSLVRGEQLDLHPTKDFAVKTNRECTGSRVNYPMADMELSMDS